MWLFTYDSLMWDNRIPYKQKVPGYILGFKRRFYQQSQEEIGTETRPGRIVTLVTADKIHTVYGIAYEVVPEANEFVFTIISEQEKRGFILCTTTFFPMSCEFRPVECLVNVANENSSNFIGKCDIETIANDICMARGTKGPNTDYVIKLAMTLRQFFPKLRRDHIYDVEKAVVKMQCNMERICHKCGKKKILD